MAQRISFEKLSSNGNALGYWHDKALFVPGPLPGEIAWVKITGEHATYSEGVIKRLPERAPERSLEAEAHYLTCSPWQNVTYERQLELKSRMLTETFARQDVIVDPIIVGAPAQFGYRNKVTFQVNATEDGLILAMHERGNDTELVSTPDGCVLASPAMNTAAQTALKEIDPNLVEPGMQLVVRQSSSDDEVSLVLVHGTKVRWSKGQVELMQKIGKLELSYPWQTFFQVYPAAFEQALTAIIAAVPKDSYVLDLFGGVGTIGLSVADVAMHVTGIELQLEAVEQAEANALANRVLNYESIASPSELIDDELLAKHDVVIVDPPRSGLDKSLVTQLCRVKPRRIIYLSCNPQTQSRDIARMSDTYKAGTVTGFDFFPGTLHLESLVVLDLIG